MLPNKPDDSKMSKKSLSDLTTRTPKSRSKTKSLLAPELMTDGNPAFPRDAQLPESDAECRVPGKVEAVSPPRPADKSIPPHHQLVIVTAAISLAGTAIAVYAVFLRSPVAEPQLLTQPSRTRLGNFTGWAVVTDSRACEDVARRIFEKNGTTGDAAVATILCICTVMPNRCGLGGGMFAIYHNWRTNRTIAINGREACPEMLTARMLNSPQASFVGPLSIGVPGFLSGLELLLKVTSSTTKWVDLVADALFFAEQGITVFDELANDIRDNADAIVLNSNLRRQLSTKAGDLLSRGDLLVQKALGDTLRQIAIYGPSAFYNGSVGRSLLRDLANEGSPMTDEDLTSYKALTEHPVTMHLRGPYTFYAPSVPGGGPVLGLVLGLIGFFVNKDTLRLRFNELSMHFVVESIKYGFARRTALGDPNFANALQSVKNMTDRRLVDFLAARIRGRAKALRDAKAYVNFTYVKHDMGSGQLCIVGPRGDAVAITASINSPLGSLVISPSTGIMMNNVIDNFYVENRKDKVGHLVNHRNRMMPGKRPLSHMAPSIVTRGDGKVALLASAVGGSKILSALAQVIARMLWMGANPKEAIDAGRLHHQLSPYILYTEPTVPKVILDGLRNRYHDVRYLDGWDNDVVALQRHPGGRIYASYDHRKGTDGGIDGGSDSMIRPRK